MIYLKKNMKKKMASVVMATLMSTTSAFAMRYDRTSKDGINEQDTFEQVASRGMDLVRIVDPQDHIAGHLHLDRPRVSYLQGVEAAKADFQEVKDIVIGSDLFMYNHDIEGHKGTFAERINRAYEDSPLQDCRGNQIQEISAQLFKVSQNQLAGSKERNEWLPDERIGGIFTFTYNNNQQVSLFIKDLEVALPIYAENRAAQFNNFNAYTPLNRVLNNGQKTTVQFFNRLFNEFNAQTFKRGVLHRIQNPGQSLQDLWRYMEPHPQPVRALNQNMSNEAQYINNHLLYQTFRDLKRSRLTHLSKNGVPQRIKDYWIEKSGEVIPFYGNQYLYGRNYNGDIALVVPTNKASIPLFAEDRTKPDFILPYGYQRKDVNQSTGLFWLKRNADIAFILNDALLGLQNEQTNPYKKKLLAIADDLKEDRAFNRNDANVQSTMETLQFLLSRSFIYDHQALSRFQANRHLNPKYFDSLIKFVNQYRDIMHRVLDPIPPLQGGLISRDRVPPLYQDAFDQRTVFYGRDADGKANKNVLRKTTRNYHGDLSLEQMYQHTGLVFPFYQEDFNKSYSLLPRNTQMADEDRQQGQRLVRAMVGAGFTNKEVLDVLNGALDIPHYYTRTMGDPLDNGHNNAYFQTIGYAIKKMDRRDQLNQFLQVLEGENGRERALEILQNIRL